MPRWLGRETGVLGRETVAVGNRSAQRLDSAHHGGPSRGRGPGPKLSSTVLAHDSRKNKRGCRVGSWFLKKHSSNRKPYVLILKKYEIIRMYTDMSSMCTWSSFIKSENLIFTTQTNLKNLHMYIDMSSMCVQVLSTYILSLRCVLHKKKHGEQS
jgi:hypothetical protein